MQIGKTVWRLIPHDDDWTLGNIQQVALDWSIKNGRLHIGWGQIGDMKSKLFKSPEAITEAIKEAIRGEKNQSARHGGLSLFDFYYNMEKGDLVILNNGIGPQVVMEVTGDYEFATESHSPSASHLHQRKAKIVHRNARDATELRDKCRDQGNRHKLAPDRVNHCTLIRLPNKLDDRPGPERINATNRLAALLASPRSNGRIDASIQNNRL